jgi:hypothetical protein
LFKTFLVPDQGRRLGSASTDPAYPELFLRFKGEIAQDAGRQKLYVSRRHYLHAGSYLGETFVEDILTKSGFRIIYPELERIVDLVNAYSNADAIVFSEGSAIHVLELCGKVKAKVLVICRRNTHNVQTMFAALLTELTTSYRIFGSNVQVPPLDWDAARQSPAWIKASSKLDLAQLLDTVSEYMDVAVERPSDQALAHAAQLDLLRLILDKRTTKAGTNPERLVAQLEMLRDQAPQLGLVP